MINKDYILRIAERFGRELAIILGLRELDKAEEALIYIDDLFLKTVGLTSRFINSLSEETLLKTFSPMGVINVESCLWAALFLKVEGEIYESQGNTTESYYRYLKSLYLFLTVLLQEQIPDDTNIYGDTEELIKKLDDYELPALTKQKLFAYYEHLGMYAKAEDILFELLEATTNQSELLASGHAFYTRLLARSNTDLIAGNFSRDEAEEGLRQLKQME